MKLKCRICGQEIAGAQGALPHLRKSHHMAEGEKLAQHRDKFEVLPNGPTVIRQTLPSPTYAPPSAALAVRSEVNNEEVITVVPNMVVVTNGKGRIGILEWVDHG